MFKYLRFLYFSFKLFPFNSSVHNTSVTLYYRETIYSIRYSLNEHSRSNKIKASLLVDVFINGHIKVSSENVHTFVPPISTSFLLDNFSGSKVGERILNILKTEQRERQTAEKCIYMAARNYGIILIMKYDVTR